MLCYLGSCLPAGLAGILISSRLARWTSTEPTQQVASCDHGLVAKLSQLWRVKGGDLYDKRLAF
jgi:hypothetical protein